MRDTQVIAAAFGGMFIAAGLIVWLMIRTGAATDLGLWFIPLMFCTGLVLGRIHTWITDRLVDNYAGDDDDVDVDVDVDVEVCEEW